MQTTGQSHIKEAIILAGGPGTRLRTVVPDLPKCLAPVNGKPFISYLVNYLIGQGIERFIFALGHKHEMVEEFLDKNYPDLHKIFSVEKSPLGTGGAIKLAVVHVNSQDVLVLNGDTFFGVDCTKLAAFHRLNNASCSICLKPMQDFDRYGVVELNNDQSVKTFREKKFKEEGLINGGIYALNIKAFIKEQLPATFSFEKDYLEKQAGQSGHGLFGFIQSVWFIDIGIPEDYELAQTELPGRSYYK